MPLIRILLIVALAWLAWKLLRDAARLRQSRHNAPDKPSQNTQEHGATMVRCKHCDIHLPEAAAVSKDGHFFCTENHLSVWQDSQRNE